MESINVSSLKLWRENIGMVKKSKYVLKTRFIGLFTQPGSKAGIQNMFQILKTICLVPTQTRQESVSSID